MLGLLFNKKKQQKPVEEKVVMSGDKYTRHSLGYAAELSQEAVSYSPGDRVHQEEIKERYNCTDLNHSVDLYSRSEGAIYVAVKDIGVALIIEPTDEADVQRVEIFNLNQLEVNEDEITAVEEIDHDVFYIRFNYLDQQYRFNAPQLLSYIDSQDVRLIAELTKKPFLFMMDADVFMRTVHSELGYGLEWTLRGSSVHVAHVHESVSLNVKEVIERQLSNNPSGSHTCYTVR